MCNVVETTTYCLVFLWFADLIVSNFLFLHVMYIPVDTIHMVIS